MSQSWIKHSLDVLPKVSHISPTAASLLYGNPVYLSITTTTIEILMGGPLSFSPYLSAPHGSWHRVSI